MADFEGPPPLPDEAAVQTGSDDPNAAWNSASQTHLAPAPHQPSDDASLQPPDQGGVSSREAPEPTVPGTLVVTETSQPEDTAGTHVEGAVAASDPAAVPSETSYQDPEPKSIVHTSPLLERQTPETIVQDGEPSEATPVVADAAPASSANATGGDPNSAVAAPEVHQQAPNVSADSEANEATKTVLGIENDAGPAASPEAEAQSPQGERAPVAPTAEASTPTADQTAGALDAATATPPAPSSAPSADTPPRNENPVAAAEAAKALPQEPQPQAPVPPAAATPPPSATATSAASVPDVSVARPNIPTTKEGFLEKFSVGRSFLSGKNWKKRFFIADASGLAYYESKGAKELGRILMSDASTRLVTYPSARSHDKVQFFDRDIVVIFKDNGKEQRLLLRCATPADHDEWCAVLGRMAPKVNDPSDGPAK
jgi:hypothetical protein